MLVKLWPRPLRLFHHCIHVRSRPSRGLSGVRALKKNNNDKTLRRAPNSLRETLASLALKKSPVRAGGSGPCMSPAFSGCLTAFTCPCQAFNQPVAPVSVCVPFGPSGWLRNPRLRSTWKAKETGVCSVFAESSFHGFLGGAGFCPSTVGALAVLRDTSRPPKSPRNAAACFVASIRAVVKSLVALKSLLPGFLQCKAFGSASSLDFCWPIHSRSERNKSS